LRDGSNRASASITGAGFQLSLGCYPTSGDPPSARRASMKSSSRGATGRRETPVFRRAMATRRSRDRGALRSPGCFASLAVTKTTLSRFAHRTRGPCQIQIGRLVVQVIAKPGLVVAAQRNLPRAPRLKRAHQDRRRERRSDEHELLKQHPLDRPKSAKQRDQKRNWEDWRHGKKPGWRQAGCLIASAFRNAGSVGRFRPADTGAENICLAPGAALTVSIHDRGRPAR
jgi:hypothetical protein